MVLHSGHVCLRLSLDFMQCLWSHAHGLVTSQPMKNLPCLQSEHGLVQTMEVFLHTLSTASDLTQDFKTGYLILSYPRDMFVSQVIGTAVEGLVS
ncbi:hypothetical protein N665_1269s0007 [Sinapis alba]|nr:hypothetical protein N665_1269s0007 [Sinapis alba]